MRNIEELATQKTGKINGTKQSAIIIQMNKKDTQHNRILVGNLKAENGNGVKKWSLLKT